MKRRKVLQSQKAGDAWSQLYSVKLECGHVVTTSSTTGSAPKTARCMACEMAASQTTTG
jgi:hypothetical protein